MESMIIASMSNDYHMTGVGLSSTVFLFEKEKEREREKERENE